MNNKKQRRFAVLAGGLGLAALLGFQVTTAVAEEGAAEGGVAAQDAPVSSQEAAVAGDDDSKGPVKFSASQAFAWDNNIFRLPSDYPISRVSKEKRSDIISTTRLGINFDKQYSRQAFHGGFDVGFARYRTHKDLNSTTPDGKLRWDWRVGDRWSGVLGYGYNDTPVGFDNSYAAVNTDDQKRVMRRLQRSNVSADYWWHPDWATGVGYSDVRADYHNNERYNKDKYNAQTTSLNVTYRPSTGNRTVLSLRSETGQYPNRKKKDELGPGEVSLRDWKRYDLQLSGQWRLTGLTQVSGYIGATKRKYDLASNRNFSGWTGKITFHWVPTTKALIDLSWRREIGADADLVANYAVSKGWTLQPTWVLTSKVRLGASYEYLNRDYGGNSGNSPGIGYLPRDAKTQSYGFNVQYLPLPNANIALSYMNMRRSAKAEVSESLYNYRARTVYLSGGMTF